MMPEISIPADDTGHVVVFANPFSGTGPNRRRADAFVEQLNQARFDPMVCWNASERIELLSDPSLKIRCIVVAGGDGSIAGVVNDMAKAGRLATPFATLPMGNENLFAAQFGFKRDPAHLVRAIEFYNTQWVDLGQVGDLLFTLMASAGFDADVVHRMAHWRSDTASGTLRRVDRLAYAGRIMSSIQSYDYTPITLEADGHTFVGSQVFVFNLPRYGGSLDIAPGAKGDDALLDWIIFEKPGILNLADYAWTVLRAKHLGRPDVPHGRSSHVKLSAPSPVPIQADGDPAGWTSMSVEVLPQVLPVINPRA